MRGIILWLATVAALVGCADHPLPVEPPLFQIEDATHNGGNSHFYFLAPIVKQTIFGGTFDGSLAPVVEICEWSGSACPNPPIARFTLTSGTGSEIVRVVPADEDYTVNWHTDRFNLDPSQTYRIRVLVSDVELGHADVDAVSSGNQLKNVATGEYVPLLDGRTLPISFRLEVGAVTTPPLGTIERLSIGSLDNQQTDPAIWGAKVTWTNVSGSNFDIQLLDLDSKVLTNLTNTPGEQELSADIAGSNVVYVHRAPGFLGDLVLYQVGGATATIAQSNSNDLFFDSPAVEGRFVVNRRLTSQIDLELYDLLAGSPTVITNDVPIQSRPRLHGDLVVYEDYSSGNADIRGYRISAGAPSFLIVGGSGDQFGPDVDAANVVFVDNSSGTDQVFAYNRATGIVTQLTTVASGKVQPRVSGRRVVWADDRNGNYDIYSYDLVTHVERMLAGGAGDQFMPNIDHDQGNRVVYVDNAAGFEQVFLFTFSPP